MTGGIQNVEEQQNQSGELAETRRGGGAFWWMWIAGVGLILYVGSVGPVCRLRDAGFVTTGTIGVVYAPLILASDSLPALNSFLTWYVKKVWRAH